MITIKEEADILLEEGLFRNKEDLLNEALRALLRENPNLKKKIAFSLYKKEKATLSKAAEIAGLSLDDFKSVLSSENIPLKTPVLKSSEVDKKARELIKRIS